MIISYSTSKYVYFWPLYMYIVNLTHISIAAALCWLSNTFKGDEQEKSRDRNNKRTRFFVATIAGIKVMF